jgi:DNA-binding NtrC family response regulator
MTASGLQALIGESSPMRRLREVIAIVAPTRLSVLVQGPTGSGKELVAAALHAESRRAGNFVAFNVCAIGEAMFEDALFGHVRGAFTGAFGDSPGFLREADGGTAFFDEVSGLQPALQAKLLRAIDTGEFRPVGAKRDVRSDVRVVAATNEDLGALVAGHRFRADLAHRVSGVTILVPSLAERIDDVPLLVRHFLERAGFGQLSVSAGVIQTLQRRAWPGNIRELKHVVEWAAVIAREELDDDALRRALATQGLRESGEALAAEALELRASLARHEWSKECAARELGVHRATIYRWIKRYRIVDPRVSSPADMGDAFLRITP